MTTPERLRRRQMTEITLQVITLLLIAVLMVAGPPFLRSIREGVDEDAKKRQTEFVQSVETIRDEITADQDSRTQRVVDISSRINTLICDAYGQLSINPPREACVDVPPPLVVPVSPPMPTPG